MKFLFILILFLPFVSALNITVDYPDSANTSDDIKFDICVFNSTGIYDLKIDVFQNDKRISKILNDEIWTSSIYYVKDSISECSEFYIKINKGISGESEIFVKLRDSKNKVSVFSNYSIDIEEGNEPKAEQEEPETDDNEEAGSKKKEEIKIHNEKNTSFIVNKREPIISEPIILNPKPIKTTNNSEKLYTGYVKYSFVIFSIIIVILYITKPRKKENEFR